MIPVRFDAGAADAGFWEPWKARAEKATAAVVANFEAWLEGPRTAPFHFGDFDNEVWKDLKNWHMKHVFYRRCAYCERAISGYYGDAEHYRPKGSVRRKGPNGKLVGAVCAVPHPLTGQTLAIEHPGYFWLAYDWRNLVPSCVFCNSGSGKNDRFETAKPHVLLVQRSEAEIAALPPVAKSRASKWPGWYYPSPQMLDELEDPYFLFPMNPEAARNPRKLIRFGTRGIVAAVNRSVCADQTVKVFGLDEWEITEDRQKAQEVFRRNYFDAMREFDPESPVSKAEALLDEYEAGKHPFCAAALDYHKILTELMPRPR